MKMRVESLSQPSLVALYWNDIKLNWGAEKGKDAFEDTWL